MILATLPRVLGPEEQVSLPVSVFAMEPQVQDVAVSVKTSGPLQADAPARKTLSFEAPGDDLPIRVRVLVRRPSRRDSSPPGVMEPPINGTQAYKVGTIKSST